MRNIGLAINSDNSTFTIGGGAMPLITDCRTIVQVIPSGTSPVSGNLTAKIWVDASLPYYKSRPYVVRHYEMFPASNADAATARITLYATQQEFNDFNALVSSDLPSGPADAVGKTNLRILKLSGQSSDGTGTAESYPQPGTVINPDDNDIVWNSSLNRWEITFAVTGFSGFFIGNNDIILPVTLLRFTGKVFTSDGAILNWRTANEVNTSYFELQRSTDSRTFAAIAQLPAAGNTQEPAACSYTDKGLSAALYYYRLRIVDKDGRESYSDVVTVSFKNGPALSLYPVPAKREIWLNGTGISFTGKTALLMDMQGRVLQQARISQWPQRIEISNLAADTYLIKVEGEKPLSFVKE